MAKTALQGGQGFPAQQIGEERGEGGEADGVAAHERGESKVLGERGLADAAGAAKQDVLAAVDEVERGVQVFVELAVDRARVVPVEFVEGGEFSERGQAGPGSRGCACLSLAVPARRAFRRSRRGSSDSARHAR